MSWKPPTKPWTARELVRLVVPVCLLVNNKAVIDNRRRQRFFAEYYQRTGYEFDAVMQLGHALRLITGWWTTERAWQQAVKYLMYGVFCSDSEAFSREFNEPPQIDVTIGTIRIVRQLQKFPPVLLENLIKDEFSMPLKIRKFTKVEAEQYLQQYKEGLTSWQFIGLGQLLARVKERIRAEANRRARNQIGH
jgi:hypothetical protein